MLQFRLWNYFCNWFFGVWLSEFWEWHKESVNLSWGVWVIFKAFFALLVRQNSRSLAFLMFVQFCPDTLRSQLNKVLALPLSSLTLYELSTNSSPRTAETPKPSQSLFKPYDRIINLSDNKTTRINDETIFAASFHFSKKQTSCARYQYSQLKSGIERKEKKTPMVLYLQDLWLIIVSRLKLSKYWRTLLLKVFRCVIFY